MVNGAVYQKQEAPNQKCKSDVSEANLLFFTKDSFIIYQSYRLKERAVGLILKWFTPKPYLHVDLDHTSACMA